MIRGTASPLGAALLAAALVPALVVASSSVASADTSFASAVFRSTHNSYSGDVDGAKGSITYQLDHGVRFVEFDIHDNGYATGHDYGIGHNSPGDAVDHGGNPASNNLRDWLSVVNQWSDAHPSAAPIVVMLDLKDDLTDNQSYAAGNLAALNDEITGVFGANLARARDNSSLPSTDSLRGKVLTLLSGDAGTRAAYRRDTGSNPAVAINSRGQVVEVHDSGSGSLWYWTGILGSDGRVTWLRHGRYDSGQTPAVALNDNGQLVEVHQSQSATTLWSHVGQLGANGEITWSASKQYDNGVQPSVTLNGTTVREIHRSQSNAQNWTWNGVLTADSVTWSGNAKTSEPRFPTTTATAGGRTITVSTGADNGSPGNTLRYATGAAAGRIAYPQTAFDEFQQGDSAELQHGALFWAAPASESAFITDARKAGHVVRGWDFDSASLATDPLANYPATNHPYDAWYQSLTANAVR